jgi:hypothetical protein
MHNHLVAPEVAAFLERQGVHDHTRKRWRDLVADIDLNHRKASPPWVSRP